MGQPLDVVIRGGSVIDPASNTFDQLDVGVIGTHIAGLYPQGTAAAKRTIDAAGAFVCPGFIDMHTHIYPDSTSLGLTADAIGIQQGVTTMVDAGSSGYANYGHFRATVVDPATTRVLAFLNAAAHGLARGRNELADLDNIQPDKIIDTAHEYPEIRGIKARMSSSVVGTNGLIPLRMAKKAADELGLPVMVHVGSEPPQFAQILEMLDPGDIVTHAFHGKNGGLLAKSDIAIDAKNRGVRFDIGHGSASFAFSVLEEALQLGILPDSCGTDLHTGNRDGPVHSLAVTMSKLLATGLKLDEVVAAATYGPAGMLGLPCQLAEGRQADLTVFRLQHGEFVLHDAQGAKRESTQLIRPTGVMKGGHYSDVRDFNADCNPIRHDTGGGTR